MSLDNFHPIVREWFTSKFGSPTEPQALGWPEIAAGRNTLIAAPTGSGKTLAAFLVCIDQLVRQAARGELKDEVQVVYVSPLKALSNDIRRNLEQPLADIVATAKDQKLPPIRALVRTGDTPASERASMLKKPPHILVTTPESLYLLLTAEKSRKLLRTVRTVIVDEIHALARDKRGSHLMLSLERLSALAEHKPVRIGLSATQKPMDEIARFLVGTHSVGKNGQPDCRIVDVGHARKLDLGIEVPGSALSAVCSNEQWDELYKQLAHLINTHRSTVVFVNTRRMAERVSHRLRETMGADAVASHHGSLARAIRLSAEERLKKGELKAIVATASLELGIDIGFIDLVCQIGSPRSIATFLQRVGRSGHHLGVVPKGRLFALTRDELLEALAIVRAIRGGRLDRVEIPLAPLDIMMQQMIAEVSARDISEDELFRLVKGAWPYRHLQRDDFNRIVQLASEGIAIGRKEGAYLHRDAVHHELKPRRAARLTAIMSGGAIPESGDYRVVTEDEGNVVGSVNEDFAIESISGDVFLLGNTSWRVRYVRGGQVVVRDAEGAPATIPFWLGEAPGRTVELSEELAELRQKISEQLDAGGVSAVQDWIRNETGVAEWPAQQAVAYVQAQKLAVGVVPSQKEILFERFFDDSGGMQLVVHAPFGVRINRAWGLAMRKRFCRTFDFELQASADDNGITLSLGPQHSFPLEEMFKLLRSEKAEDHLIQALLAAPMFGLRWRWNVTRALAVLRSRGGKKTPAPLQRFKSDDLLSAVFPLQTACFEHRPPDVPLPDHPLIQQTIFDCLHEAMDVDRWKQLLADIEEGRVKLLARDTREPSPFSHSILNANPYSFLDDAPLEERRARAVAVRRFLAPEDMQDLAKLDAEAIEETVRNAQYEVRNEDELHDALLSLVAVPSSDISSSATGPLRVSPSLPSWLENLAASGRATRVVVSDSLSLWTAAERLSLVRAVYPNGVESPPLELPNELKKDFSREDGILALLRGRLEISGPITVEQLASTFQIPSTSVDAALARLEAEGFALQGRYSEKALQGKGAIEWCERRLLARIHRSTLDRARKRVQPVSVENYWMYLAEYHHVLSGSKRDGVLGLREAIGQLQGFEMAAGVWEAEIFSSRVEEYKGEWLDQLSYAGEVLWGRLRPPAKSDEDEDVRSSGLTRVVPVSLAFREDLSWLLPPTRLTESEEQRLAHAHGEARVVYGALREKGALFLNDVAALTALPVTRIEEALSELAALGVVTADGFGALRALTPVRRWEKTRRRSSASKPRGFAGGRWNLFPGHVAPPTPEQRVEQWARQLIRRYGVVFRDLLTRESVTPAWWELLAVYRRMEARGEIRGGRFVAGVSGEQYALPEAVEALRRPRENEDEWVVISAADPLNLAGVILPGERVPAVRGNRLLIHNGRLVAWLKGGEVFFSSAAEEGQKERMNRALRLNQLPQLREAILKEFSLRLSSKSK